MMTNNELQEAAENLRNSFENETRGLRSSNRLVQELQEQELTSVDVVNHPPHYQSKSGLEVIDVIEAFTDNLKGIYAVDTGNAIKYICRWSHKNGVEDLKKARWYINNLIDHLEKESEK